MSRPGGPAAGPGRGTAAPASPTAGAAAGELNPALTSIKARLARGAIAAFVINVTGTGVAFLSQIVLARVLGASGYGVYAYVMAWVIVFALFATLGFQAGMLRFVSAYRAREEWPLLRGVLHYGTWRVSLAGLAIAGVTAAVVVGLGDRLEPELASTFLVGAAIVPVLALLQVQGAVVRALGGVISALAPLTLVRHAILFPAIGICGLVLGWAIAPHGAMAIMLLATVIGLGAVSWSQARLRPAELASAPIAYRAGEWRRTSGVLLVLVAMRALLGRADLLILGMLADTTAVGIYAVAARVSDLVAFALIAINAMFIPQIAALHAQGDRSGLQAIVTMTSWWAALSGLAIALPLLALAGFALSLFGDAFTAASGALRILLLGQLVNAATGSVGSLLTMTGHERHATVAMATAAASQIGLSFVLIPGFGAEGAAMANAVSLIGLNLAMAVVVWRRLGIIPSVLARG